jgi:ribosomal protein L16/L10AE
MAERPDAAVVDRRVRKIKLRNFTHLPITRLKKRVRFGRGKSL